MAPGAERHWAHAPRAPEPSPARSHSDLNWPTVLRQHTWAAHGPLPGGSARTRTGAVWRPHPPWIGRRRGSPLWCPPKGGRGTDPGRATLCLYPPGPPNRAPEGGRHKDRPPAPPPTRRRTAPDAQARARRDTRPRARRGEKGTGLPPPSEVARRRTGQGHETGGARTAWNGPTGALHRNHARCARHTDPGRGEGRGRRGSASAHTRKGQAGRTRGGIGPSPRNAQTPWNGVPAGEDKGHPDKMTRHTHTAGNAGEEGGARGEKRERAPAPTPQTCRERRAHTTRALQPPRQ